MDVADIRKNVKILEGGIPYTVDDLEFTKPQRDAPFTALN